MIVEKVRSAYESRVSGLPLEVMDQAMVAYAIRPRDALHFAAMQRAGCFDLASNDHHFDRVPQIRRFSL